LSPDLLTPRKRVLTSTFLSINIHTPSQVQSQPIRTRVNVSVNLVQEDGYTRNGFSWIKSSVKPSPREWNRRHDRSTQLTTIISLSFPSSRVLWPSPVPATSRTQLTAWRKEQRTHQWLTVASKKKRLTFTFPFVHHQSHDWKVEHWALGRPVIEIDGYTLEGDSSGTTCPRLLTV
jgi:hypothetical protein